jgi:pentose-5-phosphate-3-epimerase
MHGLICGVSINPETEVDEILPLLESGNIDTIDILAVQPGASLDENFLQSSTSEIHYLLIENRLWWSK